MNNRFGRARLLAIATAALCLAAPSAFAYVGPGAGLTLLGALWGLVAAVVVSIGFVLLWPFRRLMRRNKQVSATDHDAPDEESTMLANSEETDERRR